MPTHALAQKFASVLCDAAVWPGIGFAQVPTQEQVQELLEKISELHIMPEGGFAALVEHKDNDAVADVHSGFLPQVRGKAALEFCRAVIHKCRFRRLETWCPPEHKAAIAFAKMVGFKQDGERLVFEKD